MEFRKDKASCILPNVMASASPRKILNFKSAAIQYGLHMCTIHL